VSVEYRERESEGGAVGGGDWRSVIEDIKARIHSYRVRSRVPGVRPRFVDRDPEVERILSDPLVFVHGMVTVLYGPKGCGKTTLFEAIHQVANPRGHGLAVTLIEELKMAGETRTAVVAHLPTGTRGAVKKLAEELLKSATAILGNVVSVAVGGLGLLTAAERIIYAIRRIPAKRFLVVVDEVRAESTRGLKNWLESAADRASYYGDLYSEKGKELYIVALVSDAMVSEVRHEVGGKVNWAFMWNLPREAAEDLAGQLRAFDRVSEELGVGMEETREILWRLAGGNPRALDIIAANGLEKWLSEEVIDPVKRAIRDYLEEPRERGGGAGLDDLLKGLEEPSPLSGIPPLEGPDGFEAAPISKPMLKENVLIDVGAGKPISPMPREPWVGRAYAYQIPAYYYTLKVIHKKRSTRVTPRDILEEALRG